MAYGVNEGPVICSNIEQNEANVNADAEELGRGKPRRAVPIVMAEKVGW